MSNPEKMFDVPLGSVGGSEYVKQEQEAAQKVLKQRIINARKLMEEAIESPNQELRVARIKSATEILNTALEGLEKVN